MTSYEDLATVLCPLDASQLDVELLKARDTLWLADQFLRNNNICVAD
jgi:hypothetical protein